MDFGKIIAMGTVEELIASASTTSRMSLHFKKVDDKLLQLLRKHPAVLSCERQGDTLDVTLGKGEWTFSSLVTDTISPGYGDTPL
jgi:ABC-2 type transport system ATP-binding protein